MKAIKDIMCRSFKFAIKDSANVNSGPDTVKLADGGTVVGENAYAICMDTMF